MTRLACRVRVPLWSLTSGMSVFSLQNALSLGYDRFCSVCVERAPQRARRARGQAGQESPDGPPRAGADVHLGCASAQDFDLGGGFHYLR